ncbi:AraC family transcriptional regulator [Maricaulis sp.]|uniref:helix-turn-helix domain-containing protein n=1 Tax=Maricaulis sp. TaxID=1486257 RepID=UPI0026292258|nr:AraC family transcriptional regulator [Maricaulis sp.]
MLPHEHDAHQLSWLLSGELYEERGGRSCEILSAARGFKPADCVHANIYGRHGALVLSINLDEAKTTELLPGRARDWRWTHTDTRPAAELLSLIAKQGQTADLALTDLVALDQEEADYTVAAPPAWLDRVREQLRDETDVPDLDTMAAECGVHRVHLSRSFSRHYGVAPSLYRARSRGARAISSILVGEGLAEAACEAGFADQAHFSRFTKRETGISPGRLQALMAA